MPARAEAALPFTLASVSGISADARWCRRPARSTSMIARLYRPLAMGLLPIALIACMSPGPTVAEVGAPVPLGIDLGSSGPVAAKPEPQAPAPGRHAREGHTA